MVAPSGMSLISPADEPGLWRHSGLAMASDMRLPGFADLRISLYFQTFAPPGFLLTVTFGSERSEWFYRQIYRQECLLGYPLDLQWNQDALDHLGVSAPSVGHRLLNINSLRGARDLLANRVYF
jgi:hypothetical protein